MKVKKWRLKKLIELHYINVYSCQGCPAGTGCTKINDNTVGISVKRCVKAWMKYLKKK